MDDLRALVAVHVQREDQLLKHLLVILNPQAFSTEVQAEAMLESVRDGRPRGPVKPPPHPLAAEFPG